MANRVRYLIALCFISFQFLLSNAYAGDSNKFVLYVQGQEYSKSILFYKNIPYVAIQDLFPAIVTRMERQSNAFCGATSDYPGPICPKEMMASSGVSSVILASRDSGGQSGKASLNLATPLKTNDIIMNEIAVFINGKSLHDGLVIRSHENWISLPFLAKASGYQFIYNRQTQIADLYLPMIPAMLRQLQTMQEPEDRTGLKNEKGESENEETDLPSLKVESITENLFGGLPPSTVYLGPKTAPKEIAYRTAPVNHPLFFFRLHKLANGIAGVANCDIYFAFKVTNNGEKEVKDVVATISYIDGDGEVMSAPLTEKYNFGTIEPGQSLSKQYYGYNVSLISVWPHFSLFWTDKKGKIRSTEDLKLQLSDATIMPSGNSKPEYAKNFPDIKDFTAGEINLTAADKTNFSIPPTGLKSTESYQDISYQTPGSIDLTPANNTNTGIPIASLASTANLGNSASASLPYSPGNASLPVSPTASIPLKVAEPAAP